MARKKILYTFFHSAAFGWTLIHRLTKHRDDDAYLLLGDDMWDGSPGQKEYLKMIEPFYEKRIFQGIYTYHSKLGLSTQFTTAEAAEQDIITGIDKSLKKQNCDLAKFEYIYSHTDIYDPMGIYLSAKKINYFWFELSLHGLMQMDEGCVKALFGLAPGYRDVMLKHRTVIGENMYESYVLFPESRRDRFPPKKCTFFNPNEAVKEIPNYVLTIVKDCFNVDESPSGANIAWLILKSHAVAECDVFHKMGLVKKKYLNYMRYYYYSIQVLQDYYVPNNAISVLKTHPLDYINRELSKKFFCGAYAYSPLFAAPLVSLLKQENLPSYIVTAGSSADSQLSVNAEIISCKCVWWYAFLYQKYIVSLCLLNELELLYCNIGERFGAVGAKEFHLLGNKDFHLKHDVDMVNDINELARIQFGSLNKECGSDYLVQQCLPDCVKDNVMSHEFVLYTDVWEDLSKEHLKRIADKNSVGIIKICKKSLKNISDILVPMEDEFIFFFSKDAGYLDKLRNFSVSRINKAMGIEVTASMILMEDYLSHLHPGQMSR